MLSARAVFVSALFAVLFVTACHRTSDLEKQLLGTWKGHPGLDADWTITFRPDHTSIVIFGGGSDESDGIPGSWRLKGRHLSAELDLRKLHASLGNPKNEPETQKWLDGTINELTAEKLVCDGYPLTRIR